MIPVNKFHNVWRKQCLSGEANACLGRQLLSVREIDACSCMFGGLINICSGNLCVFLGGGVCLGGLGMCMREVGVRLVGGGICIGDWCIWPSFRFVCGQG